MPIQYTEDLTSNKIYFGGPVYDTYYISNAFDDNLSTKYESSGFSGILGVDFGSAIDIRQVIISTQAYHGDFIISTQYSDDNVNWTPVPGGYLRRAVSNETITLQFDMAGYHRYWRVSFQDTKGSNWVVITDIQMMAQKPKFYLLKQNNQYYTLKSEYYETSAKTYIPLELSGGAVPDNNDILLYGFNNINNLIDLVNINDDIFNPINKLYSNFNILMYRSK